jgi:hypothetical protein
MYSPRIPERLIPVLYRLARARRQPMTALVAELLDGRLAELARQDAPAASPAPPSPAADPPPARPTDQRRTP